MSCPAKELNEELLAAYGRPAQALVVILSKGIIDGFPMDEAMIFDVCSRDFENGFINDKNVWRNTSCLAYGFIRRIEENPVRFIDEIRQKMERTETLSERLEVVSAAACRLLTTDTRFPLFVRDWDRVKMELKSANELMDVSGLGIIVLEYITRMLISGNIKVKPREAPIEDIKLQDTVLKYGELIYISENALRKWILPEVASDGTPVISLKALESEGFLALYRSASCHNNYQKRILLRDKAGVSFKPWVIAIYARCFDEIQDGLLEVVGYGE